MNKTRDINTDILDYLGVDWSAKDIKGVTLRMRGGALPTLTIHRYLHDKMPVADKIERYELRLIAAELKKP
ncbi:hypothetical protein [Rhodoferax aquaticus]|uniref:Uncharacterized protein n=1 Tax=Rhodoferax aquaticus TaxID=2527691 RepID=A0A515ERP8_9BURK|nr:hypothetical protein [Rhodoferax aquaticus]QDL55329.1 hypothetical protein EXZ61_14760 [Rhodoferax aquaticus]